MTIGKIIFTLLYVLIYPALLLFLSGDWLWLEGWIYSIWFLILCYTTILYLHIKNPALLAERYRKTGSVNQEEWDKYIVPIILIGFITWIGIMPLDAKRFEWSSDFPLWLKIIGGIELLLSSFFFFRALKDNSFASPLARIQAERNQEVVSEGVYSFVRHPMYLEAILLSSLAFLVC